MTRGLECECEYGSAFHGSSSGAHAVAAPAWVAAVSNSGTVPAQAIGAVSMAMIGIMLARFDA
jgi:hypothetical protein